MISEKCGRELGSLASLTLMVHVLPLTPLKINGRAVFFLHKRKTNSFYAAESNHLHNLMYTMNKCICFLGIKTMVLPLLVHSVCKPLTSAVYLVLNLSFRQIISMYS